MSTHVRGSAQAPSWVKTGAVILAWFGLWYLTPGLTSYGIGSLLGFGWDAAVLVESVIVVLLALVLIALQRDRAAGALARSRWVLAYIAPLALAIALPFYYSMDMPLGIYMVWWCASVFWQGLITFGLLWSHLRELLPAAGTVIAVAGIFYLGHAIFIPANFAPAQLLPAAAILALGLVFAAIRHWTGTIHLILALHLAFYFAFA